MLQQCYDVSCLTLFFSIICMCIAWKGHPQNDLYCVGWDIKPYSLTHSVESIWTNVLPCICPCVSRP